jgi:hypothetical protein
LEGNCRERNRHVRDTVFYLVKLLFKSREAQFTSPMPDHPKLGSEAIMELDVYSMESWLKPKMCLQAG